MSEERKRPKDPKPPKSVSKNPSVPGVQPKNTPSGRDAPEQDAETR
jgi:hypothetical protein